MSTIETVKEKQAQEVAQEPVKTEELLIQRGVNRKLQVVRDGKATDVTIRLCFPWSQPNRYISLRDEKKREVALIRELHDLEASSRRVLEEALIETGFVLEIERIESLVSEFEIRNWKVVTQQGACSFQTEMDEWPLELPGGDILIRDVAGNLFHIADPEKLDEKSQKILWAFVD